ncbi:MAG: hypothetical protein JWR61_514 [Ferruginibacter sp.]|nr:hypothetical protein [Ferruginibacter sp.]
MHFKFFLTVLTPLQNIDFKGFVKISFLNCDFLLCNRLKNDLRNFYIKPIF